jgi:hypothetical protein
MAEPKRGSECPVLACGAIPQFGGPDLKCRGYGSTDPRCMANWLSTDPEDAGTYTQYLAHEAGECGSGCPYTVEHAFREHRAEECNPNTCLFAHSPEERR